MKIHTTAFRRKNWVRNIARFACAALLFFVFAIPAALAQNPTGDLDTIVQPSGLTGFEGLYHSLSSVEPGADTITTIIFTGIDFLKYLLGTIAVLAMILSGIKLINAQKQVDEIAEKEKAGLKYIIYGLVLVIVADELVTKVFFGDYGECLASASNAAECAKVGGGLLKGIYSFIFAMMASLAIMSIVLAAFRLVTSAGEEEVINKQKTHIGMAILGLVIAGVAEFAVKGVIFPSSGTRGIDVAAAEKLVLNFTNFVSAFIGTGALLMLLYGGYLYVASFGNEESTQKAKKIMTAAIIGIIIALGSFAIVRTFTDITPRAEQINLPQSLPGLPGGGN